jgi:hypothetical protein
VVSTPPSNALAAPREWVLAAVLFGLLLIVGVREGGFWYADALLTAIASVVVLLIAVIVNPLDRRAGAVVVCAVLLAAWWAIRATATGSMSAFLPLGASMLAFAAALAAVRPLQARTKQLAALAVAVLGAAGATVGFVGLIFRWFPWAMPAQGLWRLSTTLTYSDAAGLALGVCLLLALGTESYPRVARVAVCLCAGALLATQSRGAYVAFACAAALVPWRRYIELVVPLIAGGALGVAAIASSPDPGAVDWLGVVLVATVVAAAVAAPPRSFGRSRPRWVAAWAVVLVALAGTVLLLHREIGLRALAPSDGDRSVEWATAWHQWRGASFFGVGPDRLLVFRAPDGTFAHFAHNEYLQIAADAGLIGILLLVALGIAVMRLVRRYDVLSSCACAALVCGVVAGAFDYDWHLAFVGLLLGCCAGLASPGRPPQAPNQRAAPRWRRRGGGAVGERRDGRSAASAGPPGTNEVFTP